MKDFPGARWWKFDFHTHTPASTDYGAGPNQNNLKQTTPREWLEAHINAGNECIAITDHHTGEWIPLLKEALATMVAEGDQKAENVSLFPGVELSLNGIHYLAIFGPDNGKEIIDTLLARVRYDGNTQNHQGICEETNPVTVCEEVNNLNGLFIPAHVDLDSTGLFKETQFGILKPLFDCNEILANEIASEGFEHPQLYIDQKVQWATITGSDSHHLTADQSGRGRYPGSHFTWVKMGQPSLQAVRLALQDGNESSVISSLNTVPTENPNQTPELWIESLEVSDAQKMGRGHPAQVRFSPFLTSIIGGRGSGKSTLVHFIRLAGMRADDFASLPKDSRVRDSFESFIAVGKGLTPETQATLIYRKGQERYRLIWKQSDSGTTVEGWENALADWQPEESQNVKERFPLAIFSQEQIADLAKSPQAILQRIDEAIDFPSWQSRWDQALETLLQNQSAARNLQSRANDKDRLLGLQKDLTNKLAVFESSEHANTLKTARRFERQFSELKSYADRHQEMGEELKAFAEEFLLYDLAPDLYLADDDTEAPLFELEQTLKTSITETQQKLIRLSEEIGATNQTARETINESLWNSARRESKNAHKQLTEKLKEQGVTNPEEYSDLLSQKGEIETQLKTITKTEKQIAEHEQKASESLVQLKTLRDQLSNLREEFLLTHLAENPYVKIKLIPYGNFSDRELTEKGLRQNLNCEDSRFASSILSDDEQQGFIAGLYKELPQENEDERTIEKERRIAEWKETISHYLADGKPELELPRAFISHLRRTNENNPELLDRFFSWWPEDSLEVSYSKSGDGRKFTSLKDGSAGEKAAALLAFFLAYGQSPLIIDQPENDLDNHLITDLLVKQLSRNKSRRQIIVVSHNPNIVVNADSEMVHAMKYLNGQCQPAEQGALQEPKVRAEVCAVMEGGELALTKRYRRLTSSK